MLKLDILKSLDTRVLYKSKSLVWELEGVFLHEAEISK